MPRISKRKANGEVEIRQIRARSPQAGESNQKRRIEDAESNHEIDESSSMNPPDLEVWALKQRLIAYIARQIAKDILRDGWPSSRKGD